MAGPARVSRSPADLPTLAAESLKGGFLATVKPTLVKAITVDWLANCYSVRSTIIHANRNNILHLIGQATRDLTEVVETKTDLTNEKFAVGAASQAWNVEQQSMEALSKLPVVGTVIGLIDFAVSVSERIPGSELKHARLGDFFAQLDTVVRKLHSDMDSTLSMTRSRRSRSSGPWRNGAAKRLRKQGTGRSRP